jgi:hypothetical protein
LKYIGIGTEFFHELIENNVSVLAIRVIYVNDNLDYYEPVNEFDKRSYI